MSTTHHRYHITSNFGGLIESDQKRESALERAGRMQRNGEPGEEVVVYDSMARVGQPQKWCFTADGVPAVYQTRKAVVS